MLIYLLDTQPQHPLHNELWIHWLLLQKLMTGWGTSPLKPLRYIVICVRNTRRKNILSSNLIHLPSPIVPYAAEIASINGSSTMAAVAAAQKAERADVKGRIAEFREP
jgi:hypothetical protein